MTPTLKDPNLELLEKILRESDGTASLGHLRRDAGLDPQLVLRLVRDYPDKFCEDDESGLAPTIRLGTRLPETDCVFLRAVRLTRNNGIAAARLWQTKHLTSKETAELAEKYSELIRVEKRARRTFYFWKSLPATASPASPTAEALIPETPPAILPSDGQADDPFPVEPQVEAAPARNDKPGELSVAALPGSESFTQEQYAELAFRPAARHAHTRRHAAVLKGDRYRKRQEPGAALSFATSPQLHQPMSPEETRTKLLELCGGAVHGRQLSWVCSLPGLDRQSILETLRVFPEDFVLTPITEVSQTEGGRVTREKITGHVLRVAPRLLTATKRLAISDSTGDYEVDLPVPVPA